MAIDFSKIVKPNFGQPFRLMKSAQQIGTESIQAELEPDRLQKAVEVFRKWLYSGGEKPGKKDVRRLSWALNYGNGAILGKQNEIDRVLRLYQPKEVSSKTLLGLIHSYFFCENSSATVELLRTRIRLLLKSYDGTNDGVKHWVKYADLFFINDADSRVGKLVWDRYEISFSEYFNQLKIPQDSYFYQKCLVKIAHCFKNHSNFPYRLEEVLEVLAASGNLACIQQSLNTILQGFMDQNVIEEQRELCNFCVRYLEDPRLSRSVRWDKIDTNAKQMVIRWVSANDITLFFEAVTMDRERKEFWLRYVDVIEYSRLVFGPEMLYSSDPIIKKFIADKRHAELIGGNTGDNAFIAKIKDAVIVEFNYTGNACYIYSSKRLPFSMDEQRFTKSKIKDQHNMKKKINHAGFWPGSFDRYFYSEFDIHLPGGMYL